MLRKKLEEPTFLKSVRFFESDVAYLESVLPERISFALFMRLLARKARRRLEEQGAHHIQGTELRNLIGDLDVD